jgi:hypothetical protein
MQLTAPRSAAFGYLSAISVMRLFVGESFDNDTQSATRAGVLLPRATGVTAVTAGKHRSKRTRAGRAHKLSSGNAATHAARLSLIAHSCSERPWRYVARVEANSLLPTPEETSDETFHSDWTCCKHIGDGGSRAKHHSIR